MVYTFIFTAGLFVGAVGSGLACLIGLHAGNKVNNQTLVKERPKKGAKPPVQID